MMRFAIAAAMLLGLAACMHEEDTTMAETRDDACGAVTLQSLVGTPVGDFNFDALDVAVRIIPPNSAVTMDHRPDRLNVETDADGVILRIACG